jgi:hypothetical protein
MRLFRQQDAASDRDRDEDLDDDLASALAPGRRPLFRSAKASGMRDDARGAVRRAGASSGRPLSPVVRAKLERALAVDLSGVRVHDDRAAAEAAEAVAAHAFTIGQDIYFADGKHDPDSASGYKLLAHEVAHTVQQGTSTTADDALAVSEPSDALEVEAERVADAVAAEPDAGEVAAVEDAFRPRARGAAIDAADPIDASHAAVRAASALTVGGAPAVVARDGGGDASSSGGDAQASGGPPTIKWTTDFSAPSGGNSNRFTVGPGEKMTFTGSAKGTWTASGGDPSTGSEDTTFAWTAPGTVGIYTIKLTADGKDATQGISVMAPTTVTYTKVGPAGDFGDDQAGVGMELDMKVGPDNVSFGGIQIQEKPGGAATATGVFAKMPNAHQPNAEWTDIRENNVTGSYDEAFAGPFDQPVEMGTLVWNIPHLWQPRSGGGGGSFTIVNQTMTVVDSKGTMTITKGNASATRTPKPKPKPAGADGKAAGGAGGDGTTGGDAPAQ